MGLYLNPGNTAFRISLNDDIYVDKSGLIGFVNRRIDKRKRFICVSRPRRFGKSMAAEMLSAYYDKSCDSSGLFRGLKITEDCSYETYRNRYDVIFLNIQQFLRNAGALEDLASYIEKEVLEEVREVYGDYLKEGEHSLPRALATIFSEHRGENSGFVFIIDEWDCIFRVAKEDTEAQKKYLDFLRDLLKDRTYVKLAYMTGILPVKKYGTHSALNIFDEYSMTGAEELAEFVGFTEEEVKGLCEKYHKDFEEIRYWYDGYRLGEGLRVYNPKSVVDGMQSRTLKSFWTSTETYEALQVYIDLDEDGLRESLIAMLGGERQRIDTGMFQNDMTTFKSRDDILTLLVHLGYLAYEEATQSVFIPNEEVREEFVRAVRGGKHKEVAKAILASDRLLQATINGEEERVAAAIQMIHSTVAAPEFYNNEQALRSVVRFAYYSSMDDYIEIQELASGTGYADMVFLPRKGSDKPLMIVELKWNKSAQSAIAQIKQKNYPQAVKQFGSNILLVGISYNEKSKQHVCKIERYA
ncbi:MAG: AAA family ATPase [Lachnospiraceae bacterium]|nr:AAA family ATPase [Lachnospiraceae bacterium]